MTLEVVQEHKIESQAQAKSLRDKIAWQKMEMLSLDSIIVEWLETLSERTKVNYKSGISKLTELGIINPFISLQSFSLVNHDAAIDRIKQLPDLKETTKQARAALYISFTRYLSRRFKGMFSKATPSREGNEKTFFRVHEKVVTEAMNLQQWTAFFEELEKLNIRDALIGKIALQGGKRIREVLSLHSEQIDWKKREITFHQSKTRGVSKQTIITYSESIMKQLKDLLGEGEGYLFITTTGNVVMLTQISRNFARAGKAAKIPFKVTPHVLRASAVTYLKQQGFSDSDIMKITGHSSGEMIRAYDKSERADNPTKRVNLVM
ncbi:tyrosine-type recombinase/integrase [Waddlia chondrophila]|nr:tyrosine-type recombinase/integrase [Waddlia chondrophila]